MALNENLIDIFRMMNPSSLSGAQNNTLGKVILSPDDQGQKLNLTKNIIDIVQSLSGNGALSVQNMFAKMSELLTGANDAEQVKNIFQVLRFYGQANGATLNVTSQTPKIDWHTKGPNYNTPNVDLQEFSFNQFVPNIPALQDSLKSFSGAAVILSDSNFIHPNSHSVENAEMFMNFIPPVVMQRCVPYVSAEFVFDGRSFSSTSNQFSRPGLLRFLMGGNTLATTDAEKAMLGGNTILDPKTGVTNTVMGMEAFTSPQTLVNVDQASNRSRIISVQDPFRPFATLENLTLNVQSTLRYMSKKLGHLTLKLHDRSRMNELADFVRPATYPRTTIWLTYGWRHPDEPDNPYANFINGNLLIREAFSVKNASYSFDNAGQVQITLEIFTRGASELLDLKFNNLTNLFDRMNRVADRVRELRQELELDGQNGISKDVKAWQILDAGSEGAILDLTGGQFREQIVELEKVFKVGYDQKKAADLLKNLNALYGPNAQTENQNQSLSTEFHSNNALGTFYEHWSSGPDPFLMTSAQNKARKDQLGEDHGSNYESLIDNLNSEQTRTKQIKTKQKVTTFGKIITSVLMSSVLQTSAADELMIYFYRVNSKAGRASGTNLAEFPIELDRLRADISNHITRNKSDRLPVETFLSILSDSQVEDIRSPAYGLSDYFEAYDPKSPDPKLKEKNPGKYETQRALIYEQNGPIQKPVIEMFVETVYESSGRQADLLDAFQSLEVSELSNGKTQSQGGNSPAEEKSKVAAQNVKRIMKIHFFDKTIDLYPAVTAILAGQDDHDSARFRTAISKLKGKNASKNDQILMSQVLEEAGFVLGKDIQLMNGTLVEIIGGGDGLGTKTFSDIKHLVSRTVPTIIVGGSTSNVISAQLQSKTDDLTSAIMVKGASAGKGSPMAPAGGGYGNLPLRIFPATLSLTSQGNPLFRYSQNWFIDFNTGTTVDAIYNLTGLTHTFTPGKFESQCTFSYGDGYGKYEAPSSIVQQLGLVEAPFDKNSDR